MTDLETTEPEIRSGAAAPAVSVIIPCYMVAPYIREALDSVFAQSFTEYEVIVVNDGSPDTEEFEREIAPYLDRIRYVRKPNGGVSSARNTGIRLARAPLIALLDADDMWEPEYLAVQVKALQEDPTADVVYSNAVICGKSVDAGREYADLCPSEGPVTFERLVTQECTVPIWVTGRREAFLRAGLFDESRRDISEDFDMWLRIVKHGGRITYHRRVLARYRRRHGSFSSDPVGSCQRILAVLDKSERTLPLTPSERDTVQRERARYYAWMRFYEGKGAFFRGEIQAAVDGLAEANQYFQRRQLKLVLWLLRCIPGVLLWAYDTRDRLVFRASTRF